MKKSFLIFLTLISASLFGQRFGYVDTDYVLNSLPQYAEAQQRLDAQANNWAAEIENHKQQLEVMLSEFQSEKILLTKDQITERETEIKEKAQMIKDLQEQRYGPEGDLISVRTNLVKPIQDQIWNAVKSVAERRKYSFVFDKASDLVMLYSDPKYDISEEVLRKVLPEGKEPIRDAKRNKRLNNNVNPMNSQKRDLQKIDNKLKINKGESLQRERKK